MDGEKDLADLQTNPLFLDLRPDIVGTLVEHGEVCDFAAASYLIRQGKAGTSIFLIQEGSVSVVVEVSGNAVEVAQLGAGTLLGEISLFCDVPHTADIIATSKVRALRIPRDAFWQVIESDKDCLLAIIRLLARRVQSRTIPLAYLSFSAQALIEDRFDPTIFADIKTQKGEISHFAGIFESMAEYVTNRTQELETAVEERSKDLMREIVRRKEAEDELRRLASVDSLTGANNRRGFLELAGREIKRSRRHERSLSILMFDIDHFKRINDRHGHAVGDEVLKRVVGSCEATLRGHDILGRVGGEEFLALLPECSVEMAERVAERLREALAAVELPITGGHIRFTVSIGVADCALDQPLDAIMEQVDKAMYAAKRGGRNRVVRATGSE